MRHVNDHVIYATRFQSFATRPNKYHTTRGYYNFLRNLMFKTDVKELLDSADVQDPTDFPPSSTAPGLRALDSALRCNICQELYEAPVVLACGHCFCSLVRVTVIASARHITGPPLAVCTKPTQ
jgi:hypothetical protein